MTNQGPGDPSPPATTLASARGADASARLATIIQDADDAVYSLDLEGRILSWNRGARRLLGYRADEVIGRPSPVVAPEEAHRRAQILRRVSRGAHVRVERMALLARDGRRIPASVVIGPIVGEDGAVTGISVIARDMRLQIEAEERERAAATDRARLAAIVDSADDAIYSTDLAGVVLTWNPGAQRLFGWGPDEVIGRPSPVIPQDREATVVAARTAVAHGQRVEVDWDGVATKGGERIPVSAVASPVRSADGQVVGISIIARDVRDRLAAEARLRFQATVLDAVEDAVAASDPDRRIRYWNAAAERLFGYPAAEVLGRTMSEVTEMRVVGPLTEAEILEQTAAGTAVRADVEYRRKDGSWLLGEVTLSPVRAGAPGGGELGRIAVIRDVTAVRRAAADSARLASLVGSAGDPIIAADTTGRITSWNPAAERLFGYREDEVGAPGFALPVAEDSDEAAREVFRRVVSGAAAQDEAELTFVARDGTRIPVQVTVARVCGPTGEIAGVSAIVRDLREQRALEAQLRQAQKLEAVGRLAGGIAHDFNNLLTVIRGYGELLAGSMPQGARGSDDVRQILRAAERATQLTASLLAFARRQPHQARLVDVDDVIGATLPMLDRLMSEEVELVGNLHDGGRVEIDPLELEQVVVNLAVNAVDAMPEGGRLTIETAVVTLDGAYAGTHLPTVPGRHVMIAVSDTGVGMDAETRSRIFEPFFTTKPVGVGTGLGLSTVFGIVQRAGGTIWVYSEPRRGTTFKLYLPVATSDTAAEDDPARMPAVGGTERILLVEDDTLVRELTTEVLARAGYRVEVIPDPRLAVDRGAAEVDLLLTDVVMPGMSGPALAEALIAGRRDLRVLFMSGYTDLTAGEQVAALSPEQLLQKPFSPDGLLAAVRAALDR